MPPLQQKHLPHCGSTETTYGESSQSKELVDYSVSVRYEILMLCELSAELVVAPLQVLVQDEMGVCEYARVKHARLLLAKEPLVLAQQFREGGESLGCIAHGVFFGNGGGV
jgi:hypothetical protein